MTTTLDLRDEARKNMPAIADLPHLREAAIGTWTGRMINEHSSARVFDGLAKQFAEAGVHEVVDEVRGFANEERRHGVLCGAVVEALGGQARPQRAHRRNPMAPAGTGGTAMSAMSISSASAKNLAAQLGNSKRE